MPDNLSAQGTVIILTALQVEYNAVRNHLSNLQEAVHPRGTVYEQGTFSSGSWQWKVGIVQIGVGNARAASEAERAINYFKPDIALFVGIAGGLKDVSPGDVVVAEKAYGYESGKDQNETFFPRSDVGESSYTLIQRAKAEARKKNWLQRIHGQNVDHSSTFPHVLIGPIAAGEKVISSTLSITYSFLKSTYENALAVEMEGRGFLEAAHGNEPVQALIIRGISDLIDNKQEADTQGFQDIAAHHASAFAFEILARIGTKNARQRKKGGNTALRPAPLTDPQPPLGETETLPFNFLYMIDQYIKCALSNIEQALSFFENEKIWPVQCTHAANALKRCSGLFSSEVIANVRLAEPALASLVADLFSVDQQIHELTILLQDFESICQKSAGRKLRRNINESLIALHRDLKEIRSLINSLLP